MSDDKRRVKLPTDLSAGARPPGADRLIATYGTGLRHEIRANAESFRRLALSGDGSTVAGAAGASLCVFDVESRRRTRRFTFRKPVTHVAVSEDGQSFAVADSGNAVYAVDSAFEAIRCMTVHQSRITAIALSDCGTCAVFGDDSGAIVVLGNGDAITIQSDCDEAPLRIAVDAERQQVSVYRPQAIDVYDLATGRRVAAFGSKLATVKNAGVTVPPLFTLAPGGFARFDAETGQRDYCAAAGLKAIDVSRDGTRVATCHRQRVQVWDGSRMKMLSEIAPQMASLSDVRLCSDSASLYLCGGSAVLSRYTLDGRALGVYSDIYNPVMGATTIDSDRRLVVIDETGILSVYSLVDGSVRRFLTHNACISKMAVAGSLVATGAHDGYAKVTDVDSGKELFSTRFPGLPVQGIALTGAGMLATGNRGGQLCLYDLEDGGLVREYHGARSAIRAIDISVHHRFVVAAHENGDVNVFDLHSGALINRYKGRGIVYAACFDDSGEYVIFGDSSGVIRRACARKPEVVDEWPIHATEVRALTVCDQRLCSIGIRDDAHILDLRRGSELLSCPVTTSPFRRVAFLNQSGTRFVTGGQDGCLTFRDARDGTSVAELHHLATGFLWQTRGNDHCPDPGWLWTDRDDLVRVYRRVGSVETLVPQAQDMHREYFQSRNNRIMTMARVGMCVEAVQHGVARLRHQQLEKSVIPRIANG